MMKMTGTELLLLEERKRLHAKLDADFLHVNVQNAGRMEEEKEEEK